MTCDKSKSLLDGLPDATFGGDAGSDAGPKSTKACATCVETNCKSSIDKCNDSCECRSVVGGVLTCVTGGKDPLMCLQPALSASADTQAIGGELYTCVNTHCKTQCIP
jgi:hypothetical protein